MRHSSDVTRWKVSCCFHNHSWTSSESGQMAPICFARTKQILLLLFRIPSLRAPSGDVQKQMLRLNVRNFFDHRLLTPLAHRMIWMRIFCKTFLVSTIPITILHSSYNRTKRRKAWASRKTSPSIWFRLAIQRLNSMPHPSSPITAMTTMINIEARRSRIMVSPLLFTATTERRRREK